MTIEEIRTAKLEAQEEVKAVLMVLAEKTGLSVVGVKADTTEYRTSGDGWKPHYVITDVRIDLESI